MKPIIVPIPDPLLPLLGVEGLPLTVDEEDDEEDTCTLLTLDMELLFETLTDCMPPKSMTSNMTPISAKRCWSSIVFV